MCRTGVSTTFDSQRPLGNPTNHLTNVPCTLYDDLPNGRGSGLAGLLTWTHYMDVPAATDVVDGCVRIGGSNTLLFSEADGVNTPTGGTIFYAVIWTALYTDSQTGATVRRVYLMRSNP